MILGLIISWIKNHLCHRTKPKVIDIAAAENVKALKGRKDGHSRAMLKSIWLSVLHVLDLWASRHNLLGYP